jgi:hypothetical protein
MRHAFLVRPLEACFQAEVEDFQPAADRDGRQQMIPPHHAAALSGADGLLEEARYARCSAGRGSGSFFAASITVGRRQ